MTSYILRSDDPSLIKSLEKAYGSPSLVISTLPSSSSQLNLCHNACMHNIYPKSYLNLSIEIHALLNSYDFKVFMETYKSLYLELCSRINSGLQSYERRLIHYQTHLLAWSSILLTIKPSLFIFTNIPHEGYDVIAYAISKFLGISTACLYRLPLEPHISSRSYFVSDIFNHNLFKTFDFTRTFSQNDSNLPSDLSSSRYIY